MKTKDPVRWAQQEMELQADETSRKFHTFFKTWFDRAEKEIDKTEMGWGDDDVVVVGAVRNAYVETEQELGYLSMEFIGQMFLLATEHWEHGEDMRRGMTVFEHRMLEQMTAIKLVELQESATL